MRKFYLTIYKIKYKYIYFYKLKINVKIMDMIIVNILTLFRASLNSSFKLVLKLINIRINRNNVYPDHYVGIDHIDKN